jgi:arylformamidase
VRLIGVDVPSVDQVDSKTLSIHHALDAANIVILENLDLRSVSVGDYWLIALPLRLAGADGSPVRAILLEQPGLPFNPEPPS